MTTKVEVHPVDAGRWPDLVALFGPSGAYSGCWCMWFRVPGAEFSRNGNAGNKRALHRITAADEPVGLLGYVDGSPAGWASVAPRTAYTRVLRSPALKPDDPARRRHLVGPLLLHPSRPPRHRHRRRAARRRRRPRAGRGGGGRWRATRSTRAAAGHRPRPTCSPARWRCSRRPGSPSTSDRRPAGEWSSARACEPPISARNSRGQHRDGPVDPGVVDVEVGDQPRGARPEHRDQHAALARRRAERRARPVWTCAGRAARCWCGPGQATHAERRQRLGQPARRARGRRPAGRCGGRSA